MKVFFITRLWILHSDRFFFKTCEFNFNSAELFFTSQGLNFNMAKVFLIYWVFFGKTSVRFIASQLASEGTEVGSEVINTNHIVKIVLEELNHFYFENNK